MRALAKELAVRALELLLGLAIAHLGVTLFLLSDLGSDPFNVLIQGLHSALPWPAFMDTHGRVHLLVSLLIMLVLLLAAKGFVKVGTVICMALGGPIIDLWEMLLGPMLGVLPLGGRIALLVAGCAILAFGMTIVISSDLGAGPNDLVAVSISELSKKPFGVTWPSPWWAGCWAVCSVWARSSAPSSWGRWHSFASRSAAGSAPGGLRRPESTLRAHSQKIYEVI